MLHLCLRLNCLIGLTISLLLQSSRSSPQHYLNTREGDDKVIGDALSTDRTTTVRNQRVENSTVFSDRMHRKLQFDGMFENIQAKGRHKKKNKGGAARGRPTRLQALLDASERIVMNSERYNLWWTGPPESKTFTRATWGSKHNPSSNAIFTMAVIQGANDTFICSTPNDYILYFGTLRRVFAGDIVVAIEAGMSEEIKAILVFYHAIVYEIPSSLCSRATRSIFCGSVDERVPASVFRYYFYEIWALIYTENSLLMATDFRDIIFQSDPFLHHVDEWRGNYQLVLFKEFHPNMIIGRCRFNSKIIAECYGQESLLQIGGRVIISSGASMGTRDAMLVWAHYMTAELQEAPGRMVETRCISGGIDHGFISWLAYGSTLSPLMRIKLFAQGEGAVNTLGGLQPDTVTANISGTLRGFWGLLDSDGYVLNWNGQRSPVVHQVDHFLSELEDIYDESNQNHTLTQQQKSRISQNINTARLKNFIPRKPDFTGDRGWGALAVSRCLWGCPGSPVFNSENRITNRSSMSNGHVKSSDEGDEINRI